MHNWVMTQEKLFGLVIKGSLVNSESKRGGGQEQDINKRMEKDERRRQSKPLV